MTSLYRAAQLGLEAIDNVLSSHEGQAEYAQLREAFAALESALNSADAPPSDPAVEIRKNDDGSIDEIVASGRIHIEQMSNDCWFLGIEAEDGSYWQFWIAANNKKHRVEVRYYETTPALPATPPSDWPRPMTSAPVQAWRLVPVEPTDAMVDAARLRGPYDGSGSYWARVYYRAMIAAAPLPAEPPSDWPREAAAEFALAAMPWPREE